MPNEQQRLTAIVFSREDPRVLRLRELLATYFDPVVARPNQTADQLHAAVALVHGSDATAWRASDASADFVLLFNEPGDPTPETGELAILRSTYPDVTIEERDIEQLAAYVTGNRDDPPDMCSPTRPLSRLPTLILLCKTYLIAHGLDGGTGEAPHPPESLVRESPNPRWWTDQLEIDHNDPEAWTRFSGELLEDWRATPGPGPRVLLPRPVERLLADLRRGGSPVDPREVQRIYRLLTAPTRPAENHT